ncbi:uncharacterized protein N7511_007133 [Penicillium nucicola]|uniref:uncharacterized protein n=1 Tax=Penicillium nucicola TaxID=1850975 RepID=UPI0025458B4B|nr:uncharacterized protein N7511_007133 [Penicillium nucicola]KAJ5756951.1 hypothetical protein N7511_007133 [Penicillium nucicola]
MPAAPPLKRSDSTSNETVLTQKSIGNKKSQVQPWKSFLGDSVDRGFQEEGLDDALTLKSGVQDNGVAG